MNLNSPVRLKIVSKQIWRPPLDKDTKNHVRKLAMFWEWEGEGGHELRGLKTET